MFFTVNSLLATCRISESDEFKNVTKALLGILATQVCDKMLKMHNLLHFSSKKVFGVSLRFSLSL
jgi:hypothetical protein